MNLLRQLGRLFSAFGTRSGGSSGSRYLDIYVLSRRCREPLHGQVDMYNEVSASEEGGYAYYTRKVLHTSGDRRCFDQVEANLYFDQNKKLAHHEIVGGSWLSEAEYEAELVRFNTPPDEPGDRPPAPTHEET